ncbi:hypothetical protein C8J56DRAFT_1025076 [Mycena floridula]|nr:hypothetical protein C8J56DRAFT_1025076 [Mycena floridula]
MLAKGEGSPPVTSRATMVDWDCARTTKATENDCGRLPRTVGRAERRLEDIQIISIEFKRIILDPWGKKRYLSFFICSPVPQDLSLPAWSTVGLTFGWHDRIPSLISFQ